jgi:hypothetical protein
MATKQKLTKQQQAAKDRAENRKFIAILAISTLLLMVLMYLIFR